MYSIRFLTLALASARSCFTSTGPINLYTFAPSFSSSSSYAQSQNQIKTGTHTKSPIGAELNPPSKKRRAGACLEDELVLADLDGELLADLVVLGDVCEGSRRVRVRVSEVGFSPRPLLEMFADGESACAFLDLAEGVGLGLEVALHLAYGSRSQCRRRRHGLPLLLPPPPLAAGFGRGSVNVEVVVFSPFPGLGFRQRRPNALSSL